MREMMQKLNVVKYAASEEQKKELMGKGFLPVNPQAAVAKKASGKVVKKDSGLDKKGEPEKQGEENG